MSDYLSITKGDNELQASYISSKRSYNRIFYFLLPMLLIYVIASCLPKRSNPYDKSRVITKPSQSKSDEDVLFRFESSSEIVLDALPNLCPKIKFLIIKMIDLYECHLTDKHNNIYSDKANFEDPLCDSRGKSEIKAQFNGMLKVFEKTKIIITKIISIKEKDNIEVEIQTELCQLYNVKGSNIKMKSLVMLDIDSVNNKILSHIDLWDYEAAWYSKNLLIGFVWNSLRRFNELLLSLVL